MPWSGFDIESALSELVHDREQAAMYLRDNRYHGSDDDYQLALRRVAEVYSMKLIIERNGVILVRCPAFPTVETHGSTQIEAEENGRAAIVQALARHMEDGLTLPRSDVGH